MIDSALPIQVHDLRKRYSSGWFGRRIDALRGVSFQVEKGQVFGLLGPNGAGKTTVIKILLGIIRASGGSASLLGHQAGNRFGRLRVGYLPENLQLPRHQNARTALEFYGRLSGMDVVTIKRRGAELLERVGLADRQKESVHQFSKGMRQRLGLAQALLHDPELLILDEPTDGLDPVGRSQVRDILKQLGAEGRTVFLNSHLLQEVEMVCDHVAILSRGELKYAGAISDFSAEKEMELDIIVSGNDGSIEDILSSHGLKKCERSGDGRTHLIIEVADQSETNRVVDALRNNSVSIEVVSPRRRTLEDLFLRVVSGTHQA